MLARNDELDTPWDRVQSHLKVELGEDVHSSWFSRLQFESFAGGVLRCSVPTGFLRKWILSHYADGILAQWKHEEPTVQKLEITVRSITTVVPRPAPSPEVHTIAVEKKVVNGNGAARVHERRSVLPQQFVLQGSPFDPRLTFEWFVVAESNTFAHAAARQVQCHRPGDQLLYNPLYLHAGIGLGKTHLMQAIAHACKSTGCNTLYLTAEGYLSNFISAAKSGSIPTFRESLRSVDVLLIDDLHFVQGRELQMQLLNTLDAMVRTGRQVVFSGDRLATDLENVDYNIRSRINQGLVVQIGPLGEELRLEILKNRVNAVRELYPFFEVPASVLEFIAKSITRTGRDLEGAITRLSAHTKFSGELVTVAMVERELSDLMHPPEQKRARIEDIQHVVAKHYSIGRDEILSSRRTANIVRPRQVGMYLAKVLTHRSLPEIGRRFGGRDHTTVLHAMRKIETLVGNDAVFAEEIEAIKRKLQI